MWKAILFDLDGTIIDSESTNVQFIVELLQHKNYQITDTDYEFFYQHSWSDCYDYILNKICIQLEYPEFKNYIDERCCKVKYPIFNGFRKAIDGFSSNIKLGLVTSSNSNYTNKVLTDNHLLSLFDIIITSDIVNKHKPNPYPYQHAAKLLNVNNYECLVFEDSLVGITSANMANMAVCKCSFSNININIDSSLYHFNLTNYTDLDSSFIKNCWNIWQKIVKSKI